MSDGKNGFACLEMITINNNITKKDNTFLFINNLSLLKL